MSYSLMTKKLDDIHILDSSANSPGSRTLCGRPFLGNDYMKNQAYKEIDEALDSPPRKACIQCMTEAAIRLNDKDRQLEKLTDQLGAMAPPEDDS